MADSVGRTSQSEEELESPVLFTNFSRFYVLLLLYEGAKHGYEIMSQMEERLGQSVSPSLVYPFLRLLGDRGYVSLASLKVGRKTRKVYSLTNSGRTFCHQLFSQFTTIVSTAIEPNLQICAQCGCRVYKDAYIQLVKRQKTAFCCKYCASAYSGETARVKT